MRADAELTVSELNEALQLLETLDAPQSTRVLLGALLQERDHAAARIARHLRATHVRL